MTGSLKRIQSINKHNQAGRTNSDISCKKKSKTKQKVIQISSVDFLQIHYRKTIVVFNLLCLHFSGTDLHPKACEDRITKHNGALLPAAQRHTVHTVYDAGQMCIPNIVCVLLNQFCRVRKNIPLYKLLLTKVTVVCISHRQNSDTTASVVSFHRCCLLLLNVPYCVFMQLKVSMQWTGITKSPERWVDLSSSLHSDSYCLLSAVCLSLTQGRGHGLRRRL